MKNDILQEEKGFGYFVFIAAFLGVVVLGGSAFTVFTIASKSPTADETIKPVAINTEIAAQSDKPAEPITPPAPQAPPKPPQSAARATTPSPSSPKPSVAPAFTTSITIKGDATCQSSTLDALKLLADKAPTHYSTVTSYISVIECGSQGSGMFAYESPPRYLVGNATRNAGTVWYAGTIAHDAGHSKLYKDYVNANPGSNVPDDVWTGQAAEKSCLNAQYDALTKIGGSQSDLDYISNVINSQYYNVPYDQRWW